MCDLKVGDKIIFTAIVRMKGNKEIILECNPKRGVVVGFGTFSSSKYRRKRQCDNGIIRDVGKNDLQVVKIERLDGGVDFEGNLCLEVAPLSHVKKKRVSRWNMILLKKICENFKR